LLVKKFLKIGNPANRGFGIWRDFNQIKLQFVGFTQGILNPENPGVFDILAY
jgi:hypothetical protein